MTVPCNFRPLYKQFVSMLVTQPVLVSLLTDLVTHGTPYILTPNVCWEVDWGWRGNRLVKGLFASRESYSLLAGSYLTIRI